MTEFVLKKWCPGCERYKELEEFSNWKASKDGKYRICKVCDRLLGKEWYRKNKVKKNAKSKKWTEEHRDRHNEIARESHKRLHPPKEIIASEKPKKPGKVDSVLAGYERHKKIHEGEDNG